MKSRILFADNPAGRSLMSIMIYLCIPFPFLNFIYLANLISPVVSFAVAVIGALLLSYAVYLHRDHYLTRAQIDFLRRFPHKDPAKAPKRDHGAYLIIWGFTLTIWGVFQTSFLVQLTFMSGFYLLILLAVIPALSLPARGNVMSGCAVCILLSAVLAVWFGIVPAFIFLLIATAFFLFLSICLMYYFARRSFLRDAWILLLLVFPLGTWLTMSFSFDELDREYKSHAAFFEVEAGYPLDRDDYLALWKSLVTQLDSEQQTALDSALVVYHEDNEINSAEVDTYLRRLETILKPLPLIVIEPASDTASINLDVKISKPVLSLHLEALYWRASLAIGRADTAAAMSALREFDILHDSVLLYRLDDIYAPFAMVESKRNSVLGKMLKARMFDAQGLHQVQLSLRRCEERFPGVFRRAYLSEMLSYDHTVEELLYLKIGKKKERVVDFKNQRAFWTIPYHYLMSRRNRMLHKGFSECLHLLPDDACRFIDTAAPEQRVLDHFFTDHYHDRYLGLVLGSLPQTWRCLDAACAVQRYHLAMGTYPDTLAALVPQYLPALPKNPFTGEPLNFEISTDDNIKTLTISAPIPRGKDFVFSFEIQ